MECDYKRSPIPRHFLEEDMMVAMSKLETELTAIVDRLESEMNERGVASVECARQLHALRLKAESRLTSLVASVP
jgi:hypothetical protein